MENMKHMFQKCFGMPLPESLLPNSPVSSPREDAGRGLLFASKRAVDNPVLDQGLIDDFLQHAPIGYYLIGFWGHGINSYAFYYCMVDDWRRIFFRLPYGGALEDNEENARLIRKFLTEYCDFERLATGKVESLVFVDSMGEGYYRISLPDSSTRTYEQSLLGNPDIKAELERLLTA